VESGAFVREAVAIINADPERAASLCREALAADPGNGDAQLVLSEALRLLGDLAGARAAAEKQVEARPNWFGTHRQLGVVLADQGEAAPAALALKRAADLNPQHPTLWRELGDQALRAGDTALSQSAYERHAVLPVTDPQLARAARLLAAGEHQAAAAVLCEFLARHGEDVAALRMLSEAHARADRPDLAEQRLRRCLELTPGFGFARHSLGQLLNGLGRYDEALAEARELLRRDPSNKGSERLLAATQNFRGEFAEVLSIYERHLATNATQPTIWMSYGHVLKTVGRTEEAIAAYRKCIELAPTAGLAYWSLANLKTFRFAAPELEQMQAQLAQPGLPQLDRINLHYALGKALEDAGQADASFAHYSEGARLQRAAVSHDADRLSQLVDSAISLFTPAFFAERAGSGRAAPDPIFILGLPRSGSTLIEQVLASHSAVEGTMELPDLGLVASAICGYERNAAGETYLDVLPSLDRAALSALGERYLATTRAHRKMRRAYFIDKMPNNWPFVGLVQLILPNAKIIDARRHPMACCFSCFKQHFALGQNFTYGFGDLGRYYADYVRMMRHWDRVLPGRVHRVIYEDLVADPETNIRGLLDYCGLPFEEACLRPHETQRPVRTASSEQVRQPISAKGKEDWRPFEPQLGELKAALGETLTDWRS
jgi:tetratricopeptide (TPR) repeat protein